MINVNWVHLIMHPIIYKRSIHMVELLVIIFGVVMGGLPTIYLIWSAISTISMKVYRKMKHGISMFD